MPEAPPTPMNASGGEGGVTLLSPLVCRYCISVLSQIVRGPPSVWAARGLRPSEKIALSVCHVPRASLQVGDHTPPLALPRGSARASGISQLARWGSWSQGPSVPCCGIGWLYPSAVLPLQPDHKGVDRGFCGERI